MKQGPLSVLVLHEAIDAHARPDELDALVQVRQVSTAMQDLGWLVSTLATGLDLEKTLAYITRQQPDCVFNLVESLAGDGRLIHFVPAVLRQADTRFTGSDSDALYMSSHKLLAKNLMRQNGIMTPDFFTRRGHSGNGEAEGKDRKWIVKSVWEHASFGLDDGCVVDGVTAALARIEACRQRHGGEWFAEQYIDGREFNISVLEKDGQVQILPMAEIDFEGYPQGKPKIVDYAAKWDENAPEYKSTRRVFPVLPGKLQQAMQDAIQQCWSCFGLDGYARVDFRVDAAGMPFVLEVNANPCLARDAGLYAAAQQAGLSFEQLVEHIVQSGVHAG